MRQVKLYIAASLDGYIARADGSLDWLTELPNPKQLDYGYADFYAGIDTVLMGRGTYEEILGFDVDWPYSDCDSYVLSAKLQQPATTPRTSFFSGSPEALVRELNTKPGKDLWLVGGGKLIASFWNANLIDELQLFLAPVVLGSGIPLFVDGLAERGLELEASKSFETGMVELLYKKK